MKNQNSLQAIEHLGKQEEGWTNTHSANQLQPTFFFSKANFINHGRVKDDLPLPPKVTTIEVNL